MIHARRDYDRIQDPDAHTGVPGAINPEEPVFLVRGQDPVGWMVPLVWHALHDDTDEGALLDAVRHRVELVDRLSTDSDDGLLHAVVVHARKMRDWSRRAGHGPATVPANQLRLW